VKKGNNEQNMELLILDEKLQIYSASRSKKFVEPPNPKFQNKNRKKIPKKKPDDKIDLLLGTDHYYLMVSNKAYTGISCWSFFLQHHKLLLKLSLK
jgi:hypothetical protein